METKMCTAAPPPASTPIRVPFARCLCGVGSSTAAAVANQATVVTAAIVAATAAAPAYQTSPRSDVPPWWVALREGINRNRESV